MGLGYQLVGALGGLDQLLAQRKADALAARARQDKLNQEAAENAVKQRHVTVEETLANQKALPKPIVVAPDASLMSNEGRLLGTAPGKPEKPTPIDNTLIQSGKGYMLRTQAADSLRAGQTVPRPEPAPQQPQFMAVQTVDDQGNPVTRVVPKTPGTDYRKQPSAVTANRLDSAKAAMQTGQDIQAKLKDPAFANQVGPAMGRANTLRDFIGNPPPELANLAGNIDSYTLAQPGIHGMRSAQASEFLRKALDKHYTPEALAQFIEGLNGFSKHFIENGGQAAPDEVLKLTDTPATAPKRLRYDLNGNQIK